MSSATALTWFARHEIRLAWREWLAMMTGGRLGRKRAAIIGLLAFAVLLHVPAYAVIGRFANLRMPLDKSSLIVISATILLAWALMLSQAIESVTRVFYARADLDLIMSSPVALTHVFSVRLAAIALAITAVTGGLLHMVGWSFYLADPRKRALWIGLTIFWIALVFYVRIVKPLFVLRRPYRVTEVRQERGDTTTLVMPSVSFKRRISRSITPNEIGSRPTKGSS